MDRRTLWLLLPRQLRALPADLATVVAATILVNVATLAPLVRETPLRIPLGLAFVLVVPGYAFISALFPEAGESPVDRPDDRTGEGGGVTSPRAPTDRSGIDGIERVALSFGLSIAIVPLIGLVLNFTPWGIRLVPIMVSVTAFTLAATAVAATRRWQLPPEERFRVPYRAWYGSARDELLEPDDRADAVLNALLVASVVLAAASVGYAVLAPPQGEQFTEFYLLTEDDGELVADDYPEDLVVGESAELIVGVGNQEREEVEYTVVVQFQRVETVGNDTRVVERQELERFRTTLGHNETWHHPHEVTPPTAGADVRLKYLLYIGEPPADPDAETAYRDLHIWMDVVEDR